MPQAPQASLSLCPASAWPSSASLSSFFCNTFLRSQSHTRMACTWFPPAALYTLTSQPETFLPTKHSGSCKAYPGIHTESLLFLPPRMVALGFQDHPREIKLA